LEIVLTQQVFATTISCNLVKCHFSEIISICVASIAMIYFIGDCC